VAAALPRWSRLYAKESDGAIAVAANLRELLPTRSSFQARSSQRLAPLERAPLPMAFILIERKAVKRD
jgi:hypothetical protein